MGYLQGNFTVTEKTELAAGVFRYRIFCPELVQQAQAGQFVHIRVQGFTLRRPISICALEKAAGTLCLVFEVRGEGTAALARVAQGETMDILGPLGNGFALLAPEARAITIGGGIGVPPMVEVAQHYGKNATAIVGFRNQAAVILTEAFTANQNDLRLCTDDGSLGKHGFVTALLEERLREGGADIIYACGPMPMLKAVAAMARERGIRCQISLEERMACGVGACLGCACKTKNKSGEEQYSHVCKNGPVFEAEEVVF